MTIPAGQVRLLPLSRGTGARRYGILLLILVVTYLLSAFTVAGWSAPCRCCSSWPSC